MSSGRNEQRKADTREKIVRAAHALFLERGYAATSMEDIARAADVAIRTIYLRFESKAAVLLAYHDVWLEAFVRLVVEHRRDAALDVAVRRALDALDDEELGSDRRIEEVSVLPPILEFVGAGTPEIAGHILHGWVAAQDELTAGFREISGVAADDPRPRFEAAAVFAAWMTAVLDFRERFASGTPGDSSHDLGARAIRAFVEGLAPRD